MNAKHTPVDMEIALGKDRWQIQHIAGYWRLSCNSQLVATFTSKGAAKAGLQVEKRRKATKGE
jgi:hypothetical protein